MAARDDVERRRRLGDLLARPAGELLPHVWITFHCRGTTSSVSVMVSPSSASLPPQHGQAVGRITTRSRGRCAGNGARTGFLRVNGPTAVPAVRCRGGFVLGRVRRRLPRVAVPTGRAACGRARRTARTARTAAWRSAALGAPPSPRRLRRAPRPPSRAVRSAISAACKRGDLVGQGSRARSPWPDCRTTPKPGRCSTIG